jgi:uncharacterized protein YjbI with pentapeptide repeats
MANPEHLAILDQGVKVWNEWMKKNPDMYPDLEEAWLPAANLQGAQLIRANLFEANLRGANLAGALLSGAYLQETDLSSARLLGANLDGAYMLKAKLNWANLKGANLQGAILDGAYLYSADLRDTKLTQANLRGVDLREANLSGADLIEADLRKANLTDADLRKAYLYRADLRGAQMNYANLVKANFVNANLEGCWVFGISAWQLKIEGATQSNLVITEEHEPTITVDNLEIAQFIYLLLNNEKVREVIDTITTKVVLILGRFRDERKQMLDAIREELRRRNYVPILFDFAKPASRDITETVTTLARISRFIIADLTDPRSIPQELQAIVSDLPSVPVQPLLLSSQREYGMFEHFTRYPWVLPIVCYEQQDDLIEALPEQVIAPAEAKAKELQKR